MNRLMQLVGTLSLVFAAAQAQAGLIFALDMQPGVQGIQYQHSVNEGATTTFDLVVFDDADSSPHLTLAEFSAVLDFFTDGFDVALSLLDIRLSDDFSYQQDPNASPTEPDLVLSTPDSAILAANLAASSLVYPTWVTDDNIDLNFDFDLPQAGFQIISAQGNTTNDFDAFHILASIDVIGEKVGEMFISANSNASGLVNSSQLNITEVSITEVSEPGALALLLVGLGGLWRRRAL